jgi:hypothetical protein
MMNALKEIIRIRDLMGLGEAWIVFGKHRGYGCETSSLLAFLTSSRSSILTQIQEYEHILI